MRMNADFAFRKTYWARNSIFNFWIGKSKPVAIASTCTSSLNIICQYCYRWFAAFSPNRGAAWVNETFWLCEHLTTSSLLPLQRMFSLRKPQVYVLLYREVRFLLSQSAVICSDYAGSAAIWGIFSKKIELIGIHSRCIQTRIISWLTPQTLMIGGAMNINKNMEILEWVESSENPYISIVIAIASPLWMLKLKAWFINARQPIRLGTLTHTRDGSFFFLFHYHQQPEQRDGFQNCDNGIEK